MDHFIRSWFCRGVVWVLIPALVLASVPAQAWDKPDPGVPVKKTPPQPPKVKVNRTPPKVKPVPLFPVFSETPTDKEVFRARVFAEPLVPLGSTTAEENRALAEAITAYLGRRKSDDLTAIEGFLRDHPGSAWRASLLMNTGLLWRRLAYFTRAEKSLREAWELAREAPDAHGKATAERALRQLLEIHMAFGAVEPVEDLLEQVEGRAILGPTADMVREAKGHVQVLREKHELAVPSGPIALQYVLHRLRPGEPPNKTLASFPADHDGATLAEMLALGRKAGMKLQMAFRPAGLDVSPDGTPLSLTIPTPSVIHLKVGHFAALVEVRNDRVRLDDPFLGGELWMTRQALEEEASGYFLVPEGTLPSGWRQAQAREVETVRGKCAATDQDGEAGPCNQPQTGGNSGNCSDGDCTAPPAASASASPGSPMATYSFLTMVVGLRITDSPVGYSPPRGPAVYFQVSYNQREKTQPSIFYFSNLGSRWTFNWQSWIEDDPADPFQPVKVVARGGGAETSTGSDGVTYQPSLYSRAVVVRTQTSPIRYERRLPDGSVEVFAQPDGAMASPRRVFLTEVKDPQGNALSFTYDQDLRLISVTDAIGQVTTLSYDMAGDPWKITRVTDPFGREAKLEYDGEGRLVRITDVIGIVSEMAYSGDFVSELTTPYGTTRFATGAGHYSNNKDKWLQATDPLGGTERLEYLYLGVTGWPTSDPSETVPVGFANQNTGLNNFSYFYWDKRAQALHPGNFTKARHFRFLLAQALKISGMLQSEKKALEGRVWYHHDGELLLNAAGTYGRPTRIGRVLDDGQSQVTRYEYGPIGNVTRATDPSDREIAFEYDTNGIDLLRIKQKVNGTFELAEIRIYNAQRQPLTITDAGGGTTSITYNTAGQPLTVTTPPAQGQAQGATSSFSYDTNGYLTSIAGPVSGAATTFTYDGYGRRGTVTDPTNFTLAYDYDVLDRVTKVTWPDGTYEEIVYNRLDAERQRDRLGRWSHTFYDALRRPVAVTDAAGRTVTHEWCNCGSLDALIDPNGNRTAWELDAQGRVTREIRANGSDYVYTYEATTSLLKQRRDARSITTSYEYFLDDLLKSRSYSDATPAVDYTYDDLGRLKTATSAVDALAWTYDMNDQLVTEASTRNSSTVGYAYDAAGNRTRLDLNGSTLVTYGYDTASRLTSITRSGNVFSFGYDTASRRTSMSYPNGILTTYTYDAESRLTSVTAKLGTTVITDFGYTYDAAGNRTRKTMPEFTEDYGYDLASQLTTVRRTGGTPTRWYYAYDKAGNRTIEQLDTTATQSAYDNMNRLLTRQAGGALLFQGTVNEPAAVTVQGKPADVTAANTFTAPAQVAGGTQQVAVTAQDPAGNQRTSVYEVNVSGGSATYAYDANGNLTAKSDSTGNWTYESNAENQLTRVTKDGNEVARFTYDPFGRRVERIATAATTAYVYDGDDTLQESATGGTTLSYVNGEIVDEPLGRQDTAGSLSYYHADALGSVVKITDPAGANILTRVYDPWGALQQGTATGGHAFTGREWDSDASLYYYRARYYDPSIGRFVGEDPIGLEGAFNLYTYTDNLPIGRIDPFGDDWIDTVAGFGDFLSFGVTRQVRRRMGTDHLIRRCDWTYKLGKWIAVIGSVVVTGGSAVLKQAASGASRGLVRSQARRLTRKVAGKGGAVHHKNPLFGHPGNRRPTMFPTGGLPASIHSGSWNVTRVPVHLHDALHGRLMFFDRIGHIFFHPAATAGRVVHAATDDCCS